MKSHPISQMRGSSQARSPSLLQADTAHRTYIWSTGKFTLFGLWPKEWLGGLPNTGLSQRLLTQPPPLKLSFGKADASTTDMHTQWRKNRHKGWLKGAPLQANKSKQTTSISYFGTLPQWTVLSSNVKISLMSHLIPWLELISTWPIGITILFSLTECWKGSHPRPGPTKEEDRPPVLREFSLEGD